jgi:hypothetical protein
MLVQMFRCQAIDHFPFLLGSPEERALWINVSVLFACELQARKKN